MANCSVESAGPSCNHLTLVGYNVTDAIGRIRYEQRCQYSSTQLAFLLIEKLNTG